MVDMVPILLGVVAFEASVEVPIVWSTFSSGMVRRMFDEDD